MPIFRLGDEIIFPPVDLTSERGILAIGGDLSPGRILEAYRQGIFPWYSEGEPIVWWSPDPRFVLFLDELRVSRSMKKVLRHNVFRITYDHSFREVVESCRNARRKQKGTWITHDMLEAYYTLHTLGFAHSAEAWHGDKLVGGIYGASEKGPGNLWPREPRQHGCASGRTTSTGGAPSDIAAATISTRESLDHR